MLSVFGVRRLFVSLALSGLASVAAAQSSPVAPPPPPRQDTVGPEQLRDFALPGSSQRPAAEDNRPATTTPTRPAPATTTTLPPPTRERPAASAPAESSSGGRRVTSPSRPAESVSVPLPQPQPTARETEAAPTPSLPATSLPPATLPAAPPTTGLGQPDIETTPAPASAAPSAQGGMPGWLPILALVLGAGLIAGWWFRRRSAGDDEFGQLAYAGAPAGGSPEPVRAPALAPRPAPAPAPTPAPETPARAPSVGLVSSRLRAWLDLELGVRVAAVTDEELSLEVDIILTNSGSAAAREIAIEALLINAGPEQAREVATFFARPDADGFASEAVAPMAQLAFSATLKMPRGAFQEYAVGGGKVVVPIVAINAGYKAGSSRGRSSTAFLVGRGGTEVDKLGPFPTDQGAKGFNRLGLKRLPEQVRR